jgi:hypothetical protein
LHFILFILKAQIAPKEQAMIDERVKRLPVPTIINNNNNKVQQQDTTGVLVANNCKTNNNENSSMPLNNCGLRTPASLRHTSKGICFVLNCLCLKHFH